MQLQYFAVDGTKLENCIRVPDVLYDILGFGIPKGLVGLDMDTGLVKVHLTKTKTTHMKLGRLLHKSGIAGDVCRDYSSKLRAIVLSMKGAKLELTESGDEAFEIYRDGPNSCMSNMECVKAYDSDDIAVAYVRVEGRILARAVVCKDEDIGLRYTCIYGNSNLMKPLLEEAGYSEGTLSGCTLSLLRDDFGNTLLPYLDCGTRVSEYGDYLSIHEGGDFESQNTAGILGEVCDCCETILSQDETYWDEHTEQSLCNECFSETNVWVDDRHYNINSDEVVEVSGKGYILREDAIYVHSEDEWFAQEDCVYSEYSEEDYRAIDVVTAITDIYEEEGETCYRGDCTNIDNVWVHGDVLALYEEHMDTQMNMDL